MENVTPQMIEQLQSNGNLILVDYYTTTCAPCRALTPILEKLEKESPNVTFVKVNLLEHMDHASFLGINSVPTVMIYQGERFISRTGGLKSEEYYRNLIS